MIKNKLKIKKIVIVSSIILLVIIIVYMIRSIMIGFWTKNTINNILHTPNYYVEISDIVSKDLYEELDFVTKEKHDLTNGTYVVEESSSFPLVLHWFDKATVYYNYTCYIRLKSNLKEIYNGSEDVPVSINIVMANGKWHIVDVFNCPY